MIKRLKINVLKFFLYNFPKRVSPYLLNRILKMEGIEVGDKTKFFQPKTITIDRERPWMLKIGNYSKITKGCIILTHDYSRSVLRRAYGEYLGEAGMTIIGDNVFIGMNSIILMGSQIGNNTIVGAGSVVSGKFPDNVVIAGNPAKIIRTLDEHLQIRRKKCCVEAKLYYDTFKNKYGRKPSIKELGPFSALFIERNELSIVNSGLNINLSGDEFSDVMRDLLVSERVFESYDCFIEYCENNN